MGILRDSAGREATLDVRTLVGRSPVASLQLRDGWVSGEHALVAWDGARWSVRDLGSSNGTFVDGVRLSPGDARAIDEGQQIGFGSEAEGWTLLDAGPPEPSARLVGGTRTVRARGAVLLLPSEEEPERSIYRSADGDWVCDSDEDSAPVTDRALVSAGGSMWRLYLPTPLDPTVRAAQGLVLHFAVSRDEEFAELTVQEGDRHIELGRRGYTYLLLTLARQRLADAGLPEPDRGWVHQDDLARMLRINPSTVNVQIHRARQHASRAGLQVASELVERRHRTRQLRLGTGAVTVGPLSS